MLQYLRKIRVTFQGASGGFVVNPGNETGDQLRVSFSVSKDISGEANEASIEIWNLAKDHRNAVGKELDQVTLEAGYIPPAMLAGGGGSSNVGIIFKGRLRDVEHRREGADIVTRISCGDGDAALRKAVISKTFKAGTPVKEVVEALQKEFEKEGVDRGEWKGLDDLPPFKRPYSMCGSCSREMDRIGRSHRLYWSSQNEAIEIIPSDAAIESSAFISARTGMVDTPTITDNGVRVTALLNPEIRPNRKVIVESETLEMNGEGGAYRVSSATYNGDNRDGDFTVTIVGERFESGKVDEGIGVPPRKKGG
ncbi:hypothetical protein D3218_13120 [Aureimonas flava]|uniref:Uncharacterized protein n=1 Tax=Aureimonas flava TaxID=2320271 RepID=A0A3A1WJZ1_9HYPH|nr:hypothetical protein [Aureimonas flava]RIY00220.1 hypothetical protein D3218_13120 [Aureimonas flava]